MVAKMTMIGCFLVILSYLGTQFVVDVILSLIDSNESSKT